MPPSQVSVQEKEGFRREGEENEIISDFKNISVCVHFIVCPFQPLIWLLALERYKNDRRSPPILSK